MSAATVKSKGARERWETGLIERRQPTGSCQGEEWIGIKGFDGEGREVEKKKIKKTRHRGDQA